jgi:hypothetical protein
MGRIERTLVKQPWWRGPRWWIGTAWYRERGTDPGTWANDQVMVELNADQFPEGSFPREIHVTVEWSDGTPGSPPLATKNEVIGPGPRGPILPFEPGTSCP